MKHLLFICLLLLLSLGTYAQVGIGTTTPDPSAQLDVVSTNKGILVPRITSTTAVSAPAEGLMVYQTGDTKGYYLFTQGSWQKLATQAEVNAATAPDFMNAFYAKPDQPFQGVSGYMAVTFNTITATPAIQYETLYTADFQGTRIKLTKAGTYMINFSVTPNESSLLPNQFRLVMTSSPSNVDILYFYPEVPNSEYMVVDPMHLGTVLITVPANTYLAIRRVLFTPDILLINKARLTINRL